MASIDWRLGGSCRIKHDIYRSPPHSLGAGYPGGFCIADLLTEDMLHVNEGKAEFWLTIGTLSEFYLFLRVAPPFRLFSPWAAYFLHFIPGENIHLYYREGFVDYHVGDFLEPCPWGGWEGWRLEWRVTCENTVHNWLEFKLNHYTPTHWSPWHPTWILHHRPTTPLFFDNCSIAFCPTGNNGHVDDITVQRYDNPKWGPAT